jgi:hypothetical protein
VTEIDDLAKEIAALKQQVESLTRTSGIANTSISEAGETTTISDTVAAALDAADAIPGLQDLLDANEAAIAANKDAVDAAVAAATQAGIDGNAAGELAAEAANDALDKAQEALEAAAAAVGGSIYTGRAPTSADPGVDGQQWFVWGSNYKVTAYYVYTDATGWVQTALTDAVLGNISAGSITSGYLGADRIAAASLTAAVLAADTLTSREIGADAILARNIKAGEITAAKLAAATITGDKIAANTVTAGNIAAGTITANEIAAGTITASKLNVDSLNGLTLTGVTIQTGTVGARVVLSDSSVRFYDSNNKPAGAIFGKPNGDAGGLVQIGPFDTGTGGISVGTYYLPLAGTTAMHADSAHIGQLYVDRLINPATNGPFSGVYIGTRTQSIGSGTPQGVGSFGNVPGTETSFMTMGSDGRFTLAQGSYIITITMTLGGGKATGRTFLELVDTVDTTTPLFRNVMAPNVGEDTISTAGTVYTNGTRQFRVQTYQISDGPNQIKYTLGVTRIS